MGSNRIEITEEFELPIPRNNQVLIEEESGERTKGSIIIPNVGEKVAAVGKVLAVGVGVTDIPVGSYVLCNRYAGVELDYINRKLRVVPERDVTCFLNQRESPPVA